MQTAAVLLNCSSNIYKVLPEVLPILTPRSNLDRIGGGVFTRVDSELDSLAGDRGTILRSVNRKEIPDRVVCLSNTCTGLLSKRSCLGAKAKVRYIMVEWKEKNTKTETNQGNPKHVRLSSVGIYKNSPPQKIDISLPS